MNYWENLIWNWSNSLHLYSKTEWETILEGIVSSFCEYSKIPFTHCTSPSFSVDNHDPCIGMSLIYKSDTPVEPIIYYVKGGVFTYTSDDQRERIIYADMNLFLFWGKTRLLGEDSNSSILNDYLLFRYHRRENGLWEWHDLGWEKGFPGEWRGLSYEEVYTKILQ